MSAALEKAIRERFAAAVAAVRNAEAPEQIHALLARARGPQDGVPWITFYSSDNPNGPFLKATQAAELAAELDAIEADLDELAEDAAETVERFAALLIEDAGDRAEVLDDPRLSRAATSDRASLNALLAAAAIEPSKPETIDAEDVRRRGSIRVEQQIVRVGAWWPGDVAPNDVLDWLAERKQRDAAASFRKGVEALGPGHPDLRLMLDDGGRLRALTFAGAAVLYSAERAIRAAPTRSRSAHIACFDASPATTTTVQTLAGVNVKLHGRKEARDSAETIPARAEEVWIEWSRDRRRGSTLPTRTTLQLTLPGCRETLFEKLLAEMQEEYGAEAVRSLVGVAAFASLQGKRAGDSVIVYPDELAELTGRKADRDYRKRLDETFAALGRCRIVARYAGRDTVDEALVATVGLHRSGKRLRAYEVRLSRVLYRGVRDDDGRAGSHWIPAPVALLGGDWRAAMLPAVLGPIFRATLDDPRASIGRAELAERIGLPGRKDRRLDARQGKALDEQLAAAVAVGFLAPIERPRDPVLILRPGPECRAIMTGGALPRVERLPETGADLDAWLQGVRARKGWTVEECAERLGVERTALWRAASAPAMALPFDVRKGFRRLLWGEK